MCQVLFKHISCITQLVLQQSYLVITVISNKAAEPQRISKPDPRMDTKTVAELGKLYMSALDFNHHVPDTSLWPIAAVWGWMFCCVKELRVCGVIHSSCDYLHPVMGTALLIISDGLFSWNGHRRLRVTSNLIFLCSWP